jgi:hypothetical protein
MTITTNRHYGFDILHILACYMVLQIHNAADQGSTSAQHYFYNLKQFAAGAAKIQTIPGATRFDGPIKIADGVLDKFVADAPGLIAFERTEE